jgi:hypothetical protein
MHMGKATKVVKVSMDRQHAACVRAHFGKSAVFHYEGTAIKAPDVVKMYEQHEQLLADIAATRERWLQLVSQEQAADAKLQEVTAAVATQIRNTMGSGSQAFIDFGLSDHKSAKQTVEQKVAAVEKSRATRAARHTMGSRQRAKVRGTVTLIVPVAATAPAAPPLAASGDAGTAPAGATTGIAPAAAPATTTSTGNGAPAVVNGVAH